MSLLRFAEDTIVTNLPPSGKHYVGFDSATNRLYSIDSAGAITFYGQNGALTFIGSYDAATNTPDLDVSPSGVNEGYVYVVSVAGTFFTEPVEIGDTLISKVQNPAALTDWVVLQTNSSAASVAELNAGTNNTNFASSLGLEGSKYENQNSTKTSGTAAGADTYTLTLTPAITSYVTGQKFNVCFTNGNTGAATININGLGAKDLKKNGDETLTIRDIKAGECLLIAYDGTNFQIIGSHVKWEPPLISLGSILTSGASFFINGGAGVYLSFAGNADDTCFLNEDLANNSTLYDGSDLLLRLHWRVSATPAIGETVGWVLDYAFIRDGDNSETTVTNVPQQDVVVFGEVQDEMFTTDLTTMTGVADAHVLMITLTRNAAGGGQDTFSGNAEILGIELVKV